MKKLKGKIMPSGTTQTLCGAVEVNCEKPARINFTFMGPCIVNVFKHNQQDAMLHNDITINALHVSCGSSAHHQELKTVYTASGICRTFTASYCLREWVGTLFRCYLFVPAYFIAPDCCICFIQFSFDVSILVCVFCLFGINKFYVRGNVHR